MKLRPYQAEAKAAIKDEWARGNRRTLLVLPTGTGKTIVFTKLIEDLVMEGKRCLILAHRGELLDQAANKLIKSTGLGCAVEKAELTALDSWYRVTVGSVQTLMRQERLDQFPPDFYDIIIVDETHHILSPSYQRVMKYFPDANVLGVTATPDRGDMQNLGQYFDSIALEYKLPQAIKEGYLSKLKAITIPLKIDLGSLSMSHGDFKMSELDDKLTPYLELIADNMIEYCSNRKSVVFLPLIKTSQAMCQILNEKGLSASEVNGKSNDRAEILEDFNQNKFKVLCNSMLLTEGWDQPDVDCIVCLRPTKIRSLYAQIVGRGTRPFPGKEHLLLLDFLWHTDRHELCQPAHLISESPEVTKKMIKNAEDNAGAEYDLESAELLAKNDCMHEREIALAKQLSEMKTRKRKLVDPLQYEMSIMDQDLANYVPAFGWEMKPPTAEQKTYLEKAGLFPDDIDSAGKASKVIDRIKKRRNAGLATPKQIRLLEKKDFQRVGTWSFDDAKKLINRIAANKWRIPSSIDPYTYKPEVKPKHFTDDWT